MADPRGAELPPYLTLKLAKELFGKSPGNLEPAEHRRVRHVATRQLKIEQRILASPEAAQVVLPESSLEQALAEIRGRYATEDEFRLDMERAGLDSQSLATAIRRDLTFDAVLDRVAAQAVVVSDTDVEIFYLMHRERFRRPENRTLRHILITINENLFGNERLMAYRRMEAIRASLEQSPDRFSELAGSNSECPSAMNGGLLGTVKRGELYAELESVAFTLRTGELSGIVESPMGFHVIQCVAIENPGDIPLAEVREKIRNHLVASRRRAFQKNWIAGLFRQVA